MSGVDWTTGRPHQTHTHKQTNIHTYKGFIWITALQSIFCVETVEICIKCEHHLQSIVISADLPILAHKMPHLLKQVLRSSNHPTDRLANRPVGPTDLPTDIPGHRVVTLPIIQSVPYCFAQSIRRKVITALIGQGFCFCFKCDLFLQI